MMILLFKVRKIFILHVVCLSFSPHNNCFIRKVSIYIQYLLYFTIYNIPLSYINELNMFMAIDRSIFKIILVIYKQARGILNVQHEN